MRKNIGTTCVVFCLIVIAMLVCFSGISYAETDVTDKVQLNKSRLGYDRATGTSYLDVSLTNISEDVLLTPIKVVIDSISSTAVTVANADGTTDDGKPYFEYSTDTGQLLTNGVIGSKRWTFNNPTRARFTYSCIVSGLIPEAVGEIGPDGGIVEVTDPSSPIPGMKIEVPEGSASETINFSISVVPDIQPPNTYEVISPSIKIDQNKELNGYVLVTCPITRAVTPEDILIVSYYDEKTNRWGDLPIINVDYTSNTVCFYTNHFCTITIEYVGKDYEVPTEWMTDFDVKDDRLNYFNFSPGTSSACSGIATYSLWYYYNKKTENEPSLYRRWNYDNARDVSIEAHAVYNSNHGAQWEKLLGVNEKEVLNGLLYKLGYKKEPDILTMVPPIYDPFPSLGHSLIVIGYKKISDKEYDFYAYDPNSQDRQVTFKYRNNIIGLWNFEAPEPYAHYNYTIAYRDYIGDNPNVNSQFENLLSEYTADDESTWNSRFYGKLVSYDDPDVCLTSISGFGNYANLVEEDNDAYMGAARFLLQFDSDMIGTVSLSKEGYTFNPNNFQVSIINGHVEYTGEVDYLGWAIIQACLNTAPIAYAGPDFTVYCGADVSLIGSASDAEGNISSYQWQQTDGPSVTLTNAGTPECLFSTSGVSAGTDLTFQLTVTDECGLQSTDTCVVTVVGYTITGTVLSDGSPLEGVTVTLTETGESVTTGSDGVFAFIDQANGTYSLTFSMDGYSFPDSVGVTVDGGIVSFTGESSIVATPTVNIESGLVAYYPFNGNANDESGNGNDGTVYGATLTTDRFGNENSAYEFDGVDDAIRVTDRFDYGDQLTIAAWIRPDVVNSEQRMIWDDYGNPGVILGMMGDEVQFNLSTEADPGLGISVYDGIIEAQKWQHLVGIYNGNEMRVYLNGAHTGQVQTTNGAIIDNGTYSASIGADSWYTNMLNFDGKIDEIRIYNRALSNAEIQQLFDEGTWDFDNDGIPDYQDAFPNDPNEWLDTDNDGIGNNADTDDDNDGMSDVWELQYGLDPLVADSDSDLDGDGYSNLEEYQEGTNPVDENSYPTDTLEQGLIAYYPLDDNYNDFSGNNHTASSHGGVSFGQGVVGQAVKLNGIDGYINFPTIGNIAMPEGSFSVWFKLDNSFSIGSESLCFFSKDVPTTDGDSIEVYFDKATGKIRLDYDDYYPSSNSNDIYSNNNYWDTEWHHYVMSWGQEGLKMYIDGVLQDDISTIPSPVGAYTTDIGSHQAVIWFFQGSLDEIRIYNRALSNAEIQQLFDEGTWDFDNDGVPDYQDAFPDDPNEWLDTDNDGIGNNADTDDDNDGMSDVWELQYGLDPLVADSDSDLDGDGYSNLEEYQEGTNPVDENSYPIPSIPSIPINITAIYDPAMNWNYITWDEVEGATEYKVYWGTEPFDTKDYEFLDPTNTTDYGHTGVVPGYTYYYRVAAVNPTGESELSEEVYSFVPTNLSDPINELLSSLVHIPGGSFQMGGNMHSNQLPIHTVTVAGFDIGAYEVTQAQYLSVMGTNPSYFQGGENSDNCPVEQVSWYDARDFCTQLSYITGRNFTLPSEAQWEYACRAGTTTLYSFGDDAVLIGDYAWHAGNTYDLGHWGPNPVGTKLPNPWGLYDMHGNVWEWCLDSWVHNYNDTPIDGSAYIYEGFVHSMVRGGSWLQYPDHCYSASRTDMVSACRTYYWGGFRVVAVP